MHNTYECRQIYLDWANRRDSTGIRAVPIDLRGSGINNPGAGTRYQ